MDYGTTSHRKNVIRCEVSLVKACFAGDEVHLANISMATEFRLDAVGEIEGDFDVDVDSRDAVEVGELEFAHRE
jgi:hypothetical protein